MFCIFMLVLVWALGMSIGLHYMEKMTVRQNALVVIALMAFLLLGYMTCVLLELME